MTDEEKQPEETTDEAEIEEIAESVPDPTEYPPGQAEELEEELPEEPTVVEEATVEAVEATEELTDTPAVEAFDTGVSAVQEGIEEVGAEASVEPEEAPYDVHHDEVTVLFGKEYDLPIYTSVFIALGVITVLEVILAGVIGDGAVRILILLALALSKAFLVVMYYMHLKEDSRLFALTLLIPVAVALLSVLYLLGVPVTGY